jgi:hypothetical protein
VVARASRLAPGLALVLRVALVLGCVLGCVASCSKCGGATTGSDPAQTTTPLEPPLPAPDDLLAELTMGSPNASWAKLQRGIGGPAGILPASAGGIVCAAAGLDPSIASEVDGVAPAYGALAGDPANASFVLALKLVDLRKARGALVDGDTARYTGREAGEVTELLARGQDRLPVIVGISILSGRCRPTFVIFLSSSLRMRTRLPIGSTVSIEVCFFARSPASFIARSYPRARWRSVTFHACTRSLKR